MRASDAPSLAAPRKSDAAAEADGPGLYRVLVPGTVLRFGLSPSSYAVGKLDVDMVVNVTQVVRLEEQDMLRARVEAPAGWITVMSLRGGQRRAVREVPAPMKPAPTEPERQAAFWAREVPEMEGARHEEEKAELRKEVSRLLAESEDANDQLAKAYHKIVELRQELADKDEEYEELLVAAAGAAGEASARASLARGAAEEEGQDGTSRTLERLSTFRQEKTYVVDNGRLLDLSEQCLRSCKSKRLRDAVEGESIPWGSEVRGVDQGDGWLKVGEEYLPITIPVRVMRLHAPQRDSLGAESMDWTGDTGISDAIEILSRFMGSHGAVGWPHELTEELRGPYSKSAELRPVLEAHGWTGEEFANPPDRLLLLEALQEARKAGLDFDLDGDPFLDACH